MNFFQFDPIAGHGIDVGAARRNPTIVPVRFREIIMPENYNCFRWQFFRVHFQFVMANERPHAYDFFMIVCGPVPLRERMADPRRRLRSPPAMRRARTGLEKIETGPICRPDAAESGEWNHRPPQRLKAASAAVAVDRSEPRGLALAAALV